MMGKQKRSCVLNNTDMSFNRSLIAAIRPHPVLYDPREFDCEIQRRVWKELSVKFKESVQNLKDRYKGLRAGLSRNMRAQLEYEEAIRAGKKAKSRSYYLAKDMKFLEPFITLRNLSGTSIKASYKAQNMDKYEFYFKDTPGGDEDPDSNFPTDFEDTLDNLNGDSSLPIASTSKAIETRSKSTNQISSPICETVNIDTRDPAEDTANKSPVNEYENTPEWHFLYSLLPDIMLMTPAQKRKMKMNFLCFIEDILAKD